MAKSPAFDPETIVGDSMVAFLVDRINLEHGTHIDVTDRGSRLKHVFQLERIQAAARQAEAELRQQQFGSVSLPFLMQNDQGDLINFTCCVTPEQMKDFSGPAVPAQKKIPVMRPLKLRLPA